MPHHIPKANKEINKENKKKITSNLLESLKGSIKTRILDTLVKFLADTMTIETEVPKGL